LAVPLHHFGVLSSYLWRVTLEKFGSFLWALPRLFHKFTAPSTNFRTIEGFNSTLSALFLVFLPRIQRDLALYHPHFGGVTPSNLRLRECPFALWRPSLRYSLCMALSQIIIGPRPFNRCISTLRSVLCKRASVTTICKIDERPQRPTPKSGDKFDLTLTCFVVRESCRDFPFSKFVPFGQYSGDNSIFMGSVSPCVSFVTKPAVETALSNVKGRLSVIAKKDVDVIPINWYAPRSHGQDVSHQRHQASL
jgi:hypothetical protein